MHSHGSWSVHGPSPFSVLKSHQIGQTYSIVTNIYSCVVVVIFVIVAIFVVVAIDQLKISTENRNVPAKQFWQSMNFLDYKFILIPVTFVLLRMWSCLVVILAEYANLDSNTKLSAPIFWTILIYLAVCNTLASLIDCM